MKRAAIKTTCAKCGNHGYDVCDVTGCYCDKCNHRNWPPAYSRRSTTSRAWRGDLNAEAEFQKYEEGIGEHASPREDYGR